MVFSWAVLRDHIGCVHVTKSANLIGWRGFFVVRCVKKKNPATHLRAQHLFWCEQALSVYNVLNMYFLIADKEEPCERSPWFWRTCSSVQSPGVEFINVYVLLFVQLSEKINVLHRNAVSLSCSVCPDQLWCPPKEINKFPVSCLFSVGIEARELFFEAAGSATLWGYQYTEHLKRRRLPKQH